MNAPRRQKSTCNYARFVAVLILLICCHPADAQEDPRYNRFQHRIYHWETHHGSKFSLYFPSDVADSLHTFLLTETPRAIEKLKKATIRDVPKSLNIIVYPSVDKMYESNIGAREHQQFTLPTFAYKGRRIVLSFNGSYTELKDQLYDGLSRALWENEFRENTGSSNEPEKKTKSRVGSRSRTDPVPYWFKEGAIRYFAYGWTIEAEDKFKQSFEQNEFTSWQQVLGYEPRLSGHAFCYFLSQNYFPTAVAQTVFQLRKKKSLSRAIRLITKRDLDTLYTQCFSYYSSRFRKSHTATERIGDSFAIPHHKGIIQHIVFNKTQDYAAYILLKSGKRTVYVYDIKSTSTRKITSYVLPPWIDDHSLDQYPLVAWHPDGRQLHVVKPKKGKISVNTYDLNGTLKETSVILYADGIASIEPLSEPDFLLSAFRNGQSDIVSYNAVTEKFKPYTDDAYDDSDPVYAGNSDDIVYISNRPINTDSAKAVNVDSNKAADFQQGVFRIKGKHITSIATDTVHFVRWRKPVFLQNSKVLATNTKYGTERDVPLNYSDKTAQYLGNHAPFQYLKESDQIVSFRSNQDSIYIRRELFSDWSRRNASNPTDTISPWLEDYNRILAAQARKDSLRNRNKDTTHSILDDVFAPKNNKKKDKKKKENKNKPIANDSKEITPYFLQLHSAYFSAQVNNDYFINRYQPYFSYQGQFKFPELGGMTKGGVADLFENHHFTIAYALPASMDGSTFFARYENTERNIDWGLAYYRKVEALKPDPHRNWMDENGNPYPNDAKVKTHYYELFLKKPLAYDCSVGLSTSVRQDRTVFLATDKYSLDFPSIESAWSISTLSYNLNKLNPTIPYLHKGFTANATIDLVKGFSQDESFLYGVAVTAGYHFPVYKYITLVLQLHTRYSGGDEYMLYNLGGVDNNVTPRVDTTVHFPQAAPYAFQTLITPFRGRYQNSLFGNEYVLANADLYFPIFQTLIPIQTNFSFINNLQLGILGDVATAEETWNPHNPNNGKWLGSYGISARSMLAGYPLRLEVAWPGTFDKEPVWYFSLNLQ